MASEFRQRFEVIRRVFGNATKHKKNLGYGGYETEALGFHDMKPYYDVTSDGRFYGYDGSLWQYFKAPENVKIDDNPNRSMAVQNQAFFIQFVDQLGEAMMQSEKTVNDIRRRFKVFHTVDIVDNVKGKDGTPPMQMDYLSRIPVRRPMWTGYIGVQLMRGSGYSEAYSLAQKAERWIEMQTSDTKLAYWAYHEDQQFVNSLAMGLSNPLVPLDFKENPEDYERLTAWHGVSDEEFAMERTLQNTRFQEPIHGNSIISERWGEITLSAITPKEDVFASDPQSEISRWATPLFSPPSNVVAVWTSGEIRAANVAANVLDNKALRRQESLEKSRDQREMRSSKKETAEELSKLDEGIELARMFKHAMIDNAEIIVATRVDDNGPGRLKKFLNGYDMDLAPLRLRQPQALMSSFPAYPDSVFKAPKTNIKRAKLSNQMFAGALAMSGIFRNTGAGDPRDPVFLGFVDSMHEYKEISFGLTDAYWMTGAPIMVVTGATGSGKAVALSTPILLPDGSHTTMGEVQVGDVIVSGAGTPTSVTFKSQVQEDHEVFQISLSNGSVFTVDESHQFPLMLGKSTSFREHNEKIGLAYDGLMEKAESFDPKSLVPIDELHSIIQECGADCVWPSTSSLLASMEFENCTLADNSDANGAVVRARETLFSLAHRVSDRVAVQGLGRDATFTRMTVGEMFAEGIRNDDGSLRFSIPSVSAIQFDSNDVMDDPYHHGLNYARGKMDPDEVARVIPESREGSINLSVNQRLAFFQGMMDASGYTTTNECEVGFANESWDVTETFDVLALQLGFALTPHRPATRADAPPVFTFSPDRPVFRDQDKAQGYRLSTPQGLQIVSIEPVESVPVACISVDSPDHTYVIGDGIVTCNTQTLLQCSKQIQNLGFNQVFLNPKPMGSLVPFYKAMDGLTINFGAKYLDNQPGLLDLYNYYYTEPNDIVGKTYDTNDEELTPEAVVRQNRSVIAKKLFADISDILDLDKEVGAKARAFSTKLNTIIAENTLNPLSRCSGDVIFGIKDKRTGKQILPGLNLASEHLKGSDDYIDIEEFIRNRMKSSLVWRAMISTTPVSNNQLARDIKSGKPILIEWDGSFAVPDSNKSRDNYSAEEIDSIISIQTVFMIAVHTIGADRSGGALFIDEAWSIKSPQVMALLNRSGREWRQYNIQVILSTQYLQDLIAPDEKSLEREGNLGKSVDRYLILNIAEEDDTGLSMFYRISGIERTPAMDKYMRTGRVRIDKKTGQVLSVPHGFWVDRFHDIRTKIIMGPYPEKELELGRTDGYGEEARRRAGLYVDADEDILEGIDGLYDSNMSDMIAREDERSMSNLAPSDDDEERFGGILNRRARQVSDEE